MSSLLLENYLLNNNIINKKSLDEIIQNAKTQKLSVISYIAQHKIIPPNNLVHISAKIYQKPIVDLTQYSNNNIPLNLFPTEFINQNNILPIKKDGTHIDVAMIDADDLKTIELIKFQTGLHVNIFLARYDQLQNLIQQITTINNTQSLTDIYNITSQQKIDHKPNFTEINDANNEPLIRFINDILEDAIYKNASDIHFEVYENTCRVRFRQDGLLHEISQPPKHIARRLAACLKIMAKLDIAECRLPQDGHCKIKLRETTVEARVNSCPTTFGEKIVLRLLSSHNILRDIHHLNLNTQQHKDFLAALHKPQGLILVTGPTGSGKTVTLYAALQYLNKIEKNISAVEDPIEINLPGINQININNKAGLTFSKTLRAFLRQDPDIIMVGEIRDLETAEIAIKASQTGHLVLSTLHTNSAMEALTRLRNMGIAPYNITSSVTLITAQRLARKLCPHCKQPQQLSTAMQKQFNIANDAHIFQPNNCANCTNGYSGRLAIHETLTINPEIQELILQKNILHNSDQNFMNLQQAGLEKVYEGVTSLEEITRIINF